MPGTYSQILLHLVWATKHRQRFIVKHMQSQLHPYLGGIIRAEKGVAYAIGGVEDHVHALIRWRTDRAVSTSCAP